MNRITIAMLGVFVTSCSNPPCPTPEKAQKAGAAFEQCVLMTQDGAGGYGCGARAYNTFCVKP